MVKKINFIVLIVLIATILININFISAVHIVNFSSGLNTVTIDEDITNLFNISVNNTINLENISAVNVTLYDNFIFKAASNGTNAGWESFQNTSSIIGWLNTSGLVMNMTRKYFWFNATAINPGTYNITVTTLRLNGTSTLSNLSVTVNDKTSPYYIGFVSPTPSAYSNLSHTFIPVNISVNDSYSNVDTVRIFLYNTTGLVNHTDVTAAGGINATGAINFTGLIDGIYYINSTANDSAGNENLTGPTRTITLDNVIPNINVFNPVNNSVYYTNYSIVLNFSTSDTNPSYYWFRINMTNNTGTSINTMYTVPIVLNYTVAGIHNITIFINDTANNTNSVTYFLNITNLDTTTTYIASGTSYNVSSGIANIVVPYNSTLQTVTLTNTTQPANLDLSELLNNGVVSVGGNNISLITMDTSNNYTAFIQSGTNISGSSWNGKIALPNLNSSLSYFTAPSSGTTNSVADFGSSSIELDFSKPVEVIIRGMHGKSAAWTRGNLTLYDIPTKCNSGNSTNGTAPTNIDSVSTRECFMTDGSDLLIWTYHFSTFAAYTPYSAPASASSSSSGSGNGYWVNTQSVTLKQFEEGYTQSLSKKYRVLVSIDKVFHYIGVVDITATSATINISSKSFQQVFNIGDEKKFDLNDDRYNDISVKLNSISNNKANITIKKINESIELAPASPATTTPAAESTPTTPASSGEAVSAKSSNILYWIIGIIIVIIAVIIIAYLMAKKKKKKVHQKIKVFY